METKQMIKNAKKRSWEEFGQKTRKNYSENQKLFYNTLKHLKQKNTSKLKSMKDKDGNWLTEEKEIMQRWKEYFEELTEIKQDEKQKDTEVTEIEYDGKHI